MCSIFTYNLTSQNFDIFQPIVKNINVLKGRALPYSQAPTLNWNNKSNVFELRLRNFSLIPHWSKEKKVKYSTHNARLFGEDKMPIFNRPSWKVPFIKNHCIIFIESFIEAVYEGPYAGNLISFRKIDESSFFIPAIFDDWVDNSSGEVIESFSILTHEPCKFISDAGHDRSPVFLDDKSALKWLRMENIDPTMQLNFLKDNIIEHNLQVTIDRPLKNFALQNEFKF